MHRYAQNEFENQAESYAKSMTKNKKVYSSEHELKRLFTTAASMIRTNLIQILVSRASAMFNLR